MKKYILIAVIVLLYCELSAQTHFYSDYIEVCSYYRKTGEISTNCKRINLESRFFINDDNKTITNVMDNTPSIYYIIDKFMEKKTIVYIVKNYANYKAKLIIDIKNSTITEIPFIDDDRINIFDINIYNIKY